MCRIGGVDVELNAELEAKLCDRDYNYLLL